jgi:glycosyltransferase involved in cell wall biosynthesis
VRLTGDRAANTTVVIPVWDDYVAGFLSRGLVSLQKQEPAVRIVIVDNASTAELPQLEAVEVVRSPRRLSLGAARNLGLERVSTPHVIFWDADDEMLPGTLAFLEAAIGSDPGLVAFAAAIVEDAGGIRHRWPRKWVSRLVRAPTLFALIDCVWSLYPSTGATIMRTALVSEAGGYWDAESGEDWCLGVSLAFRGRIGWSERPGRIYSLDAESVWARHMTARHQLDHARAVRQRLREDPAVPSWVRATLPAIALGQYAAILAHLGVAAARGARR